MSSAAAAKLERATSALGTHGGVLRKLEAQALPPRARHGLGARAPARRRRQCHGGARRPPSLVGRREPTDGPQAYDDTLPALRELVRAAGRRPPSAATEPAIALLRCCVAAAPGAAGRAVDWRSTSAACSAPMIHASARWRRSCSTSSRASAFFGNTLRAFNALSADPAAQRAFLGAAAGRAFEAAFLHTALSGVHDRWTPPLTLAAIKGYFDPGPPSAHGATKRQLLLAARARSRAAPPTRSRRRRHRRQVPADGGGDEHRRRRKGRGRRLRPRDGIPRGPRARSVAPGR